MGNYIIAMKGYFKIMRLGKLGIIGAMEIEVGLFIENLVDLKVEEYANIKFYIGKLEDRDVVIAKSGIGKVNSGMCTQIMISRFGVEVIINTGVAGAISKELSIYDVVIGESVIQYDFDLTSFGYNIGRIPNMKEANILCTESLANKAFKAVKELFGENKVKKGVIVTGDKFINNQEKKKWLRDELNGMCGEMESGAIGQVCTLNSVPYIIVRVISDKADQKASINIEEFVENASIESKNIVTEIIKIL